MLNADLNPFKSAFCISLMITAGAIAGAAGAIRAADAFVPFLFGTDDIPYRQRKNGNDHQDDDNILHISHPVQCIGSSHCGHRARTGM